MSKAPKQIEFLGYDLGHGETAIGRAHSGSHREPEILEYHGERTFVSAVAKTGRDVRIGAEAVNLAALKPQIGKTKRIWVKFKSRDLNRDEVKVPTQLFTKELFKGLTDEAQIQGPSKSRFIVGCPSGWSGEDREIYADVFREAGLKTCRVVPESRAALMTALEQGYLSLEAARDSVLIVDIGSSTTDFTYCRDMNAEDVGHNFLGSGLLDRLIYDRNLARQKSRKQIEKLIAKYPQYQPIMEYWCRLAKEQYFNGSDVPVETIHRLPIAGGVLFEIRIDKEDAKTILSQPIAALNGFSWPQAFDYALKETLDMLGERAPNTVLLTGGASRLPLVAPAAKKAFPNSTVVRGAEPEFAIARGLAWLGRFEYLHDAFKTSVKELTAEDGEVREIAHTASFALGDRLAPALVDALIENCVIPVFQEWRRGEIERLIEVEDILQTRVSEWLVSDAARDTLRPVIDEWFARLQRNIETVTDPLCRDHGLPAMVLSLDDSAHISRHLEGLSVGSPQLANLEQDTAIAGTTISAILIGIVLAKAQLLVPLLANPFTFIVAAGAGLGGVIFGRKALEGKMRSSKIPKVARSVMTDKRLKKASAEHRSDLILAVQNAWSGDAAQKVHEDLTATLHRALIERTDERAVLFLI